MPRPIALLTDFGYADAYAGIMRAVIQARLPGAMVFDLTHGISPQDIRAGALQLRAALPFCPPDCVVVAVVDPGVGSERRAICIRSGDRLLVGPDNGLMWLAAAAANEPEAWILDRPEHWLPHVGASFHGRDIFAPVAAALAAGLAPDEVGTRIGDPVRMHFPEPTREGDGWRGEVLLIDGFGNAITNFRPEHLTPAGIRLRIGDVELVGPASHYAAVAEGAPVLLITSYGLLEIAVNGGSAGERFGLEVGDPVVSDPRC